MSSISVQCLHCFMGLAVSYMSKTDHDYDIVDILKISIKFCRYRYKHTVTISSIWFDIVRISAKFCRYRYKHTVTISTGIVDIVDIVTISTHILTISSISKRYRRGFVNIHTSTLWWYRRYRYDINKVLSISIQAHCDDIVDIVTISTLRYRHIFHRYHGYRNDIDKPLRNDVCITMLNHG